MNTGLDALSRRCPARHRERPRGGAVTPLERLLAEELANRDAYHAHSGAVAVAPNDPRCTTTAKN
jgi:hypothetical protein